MEVAVANTDWVVPRELGFTEVQYTMNLPSSPSSGKSAHLYPRPEAQPHLQRWSCKLPRASACRRGWGLTVNPRQGLRVPPAVQPYLSVSGFLRLSGTNDSSFTELRGSVCDVTGLRH